MYIFVHGALEMSEKCSCEPGTDVSLSGEDKFLSASRIPLLRYSMNTNLFGKIALKESYAFLFLYFI